MTTISKLKNLALPISLFAIVLCVLSACSIDEDFYALVPVNEDNPIIFNYRNTVNVPVKISVGRPALVRMYVGDPDNEADATEIMTAYTDAGGFYSGKLSLPSRFLGHDVYLKAADISLRTVAAKSGLTFTNTALKSRAYTSTDHLHDGVTNTELGENTVLDKDWCAQWSAYFRDHLKEKEDNRVFVKDGNCDLKVKGESSFNVAFLYSGASIRSRIYYYYYKTEDAGKLDRLEIYNKFKKDEFMLYADYLPNEAASDHGFINSGANDAEKCIVGKCQTLMYRGENADEAPSDRFPKGYSVGFFLFSNYDDIMPPVFSNYVMNDFSSDACTAKKYRPFEAEQWRGYANDHHQDKHCARFLTNDPNTLILGLEDNPMTDERVHGLLDNDKDLNDFILAVSFWPNDGVDTDNDDKLDELTPGTPIEGTLIFEDLFPSQGDYDMNDVMIRYRYEPMLTKEGEDQSYVKWVNCKFEPYHDGAAYTNEFHIRYMAGNTELAYSKVFDDHKSEVAGKRMSSVVLEFSPEALNANNTVDELKNLVATSFDPYILCKETGYEVHLTGKYAKDRDKNEKLEPNLQIYWSGQNGKYPFAIDIPATDFKPVTEARRIETEYTGYSRWVESGGAECTDWYKSKH